MSDAAARALRAWFADPLKLAPLGEGHINDTWLVESPDGARLVLQRVSRTVFPEPRAVADKVARVVTHLRAHPLVRVPALLPSATGFWHEDAGGGVWRLWEFAAGTRSLQALNNPTQGRAAGAAFGRLQLALTGLPGPVPDPIPGFMQLDHYLAQLDATSTSAATDADVGAALAVVDARRSLAGVFAVRDRLIHGDGKIDNLLFHQHVDEVACVIDLDTVMVGNWAWDFGDLARSAAAEGVQVSVARFAAIAQGFVSSGALAAAPCGAERVEALLLAPRYVALMLGVRFLTDHLRGDRYFKVRARGENLVRACRQLALLQDMERQERALREAVAAL